MQKYISNLKASARTKVTPYEVRNLRWVGIILAVVGALAILLPQIASLGAELLVAWIMTFWGALGLWFSWSIRPTSEWRFGLVAFGLLFLMGVAFVLFPVAGIATLTVLMMLSLLLEGILSILFGLRSSAHVSNWGWLVFNGLCSFAAGIVILFGWPGTASWTLGLIMGLNFFSTGLSLVMLASSSKGVN